MAQRDIIKAVVEAAVVEVFRVRDVSTVTEETSAEDIGGWNSLSHAKLLARIETKLGRQLPLERVYAAANVGELIDFIDSTDQVQPGTREQTGGEP